MNSSEKQKLALRTAVVSGIFTAIICVVMLLNFWQLKRSDPLESKALKTLVQRFESDRRNEELKQEIRDLDLMARKAYFTKQWQIRAGSYMLVGGMALLVLSLRVYYSIKSRIPEPVKTESRLELDLMLSRQWILYVVFLVFGLALVAAFRTQDHLSDSYASDNSGQVENDASVEEISIRQNSDSSKENTGNNQTLNDQSVRSIPGENESGKQDSGNLAENKPVIDNMGTTSSLQPGSNLPFPGFRGPNGLGLSPHKNTPVDWDGKSGKNILWKKAVPYAGYNSPVTWGERLFLTGADQTNQFVYCYNRNTGDLLWQHQVNNIERPAGKIKKPSEDTGYAAPTVTTDGIHVFAIFASGDIICLDMKGSSIWAKNLGLPDNHYGHASSLILWKGLLLIQYDTNKSGKVMALDAGTGKQQWETQRKSKISWASPVLADIDGRAELILSSSPQVAAYDPSNGKELWAIDCLTGEVGPSPAFSSGIVFAANEYSKLVAIKPGEKPVILWENNEYLPEVSSPVASDGMVFIATSYGVVACYDAANGKILWEHECEQGIYASPIIADGKVYVLDIEGNMHIFSKSKTMKLEGEPALGEKTVCTPAFADGRIYLRGKQNLYCIGKK